MPRLLVVASALLVLAVGAAWWSWTVERSSPTVAGDPKRPVGSDRAVESHPAPLARAPDAVASARSPAETPGLAASQRDAIGTGQPDAIVLSGRLVHANGENVDQASFSLHFCGEGMAIGTTDRRGGFRVVAHGVAVDDELTDGAAFLLQTEAGRAPETARLPTLTLSAGDNDLGPLVIAPPPLLVAGRMTGGAPAAGSGLRLEITHRAGADAPALPLQVFVDWPEADETEAATLGRPFAIRGLPGTGDHRLAVVADQRDAQNRGPWAEVAFTPGQRDLLVALPARGRLEIVVVTAGGDGAPHADALMPTLVDERGRLLPPSVRGPAGGWSPTAEGSIASLPASPAGEPGTALAWGDLVAGRYAFELRALGNAQPLHAQTLDVAGGQGPATTPIVVRLAQAFAETRVHVTGAEPPFALVTGGEPPLARIFRGPSITMHGPVPMDFDLVAPGRAPVAITGLAGETTISPPPPRLVTLALPRLDATTGWPEGSRGELVVEARDADGLLTRTVLIDDRPTTLAEALGTTRRFALGTARHETIPAPPGGSLHFTVRVWSSGQAPRSVPIAGPSERAVDTITGAVPIVLDAQ